MEGGGALGSVVASLTHDSVFTCARVAVRWPARAPAGMSESSYFYCVTVKFCRGAVGGSVSGHATGQTIFY